MNSVRSKSLSLKYHRFTASGCKDIEIRKFEFVAKTQFLWIKSNKVHKVLKSKTEIIIFITFLLKKELQRILHIFLNSK